MSSSCLKSRKDSGDENRSKRVPLEENWYSSKEIVGVEYDFVEPGPSRRRGWRRGGGTQ